MAHTINETMIEDVIPMPRNSETTFEQQMREKIQL
jgi:hypothetical protein